MTVYNELPVTAPDSQAEQGTGSSSRRRRRVFAILAATPPPGTPSVANRAVTTTDTVSLTNLVSVFTPTDPCFAVTTGSGLASAQAGSVTRNLVAASGAGL
ncbi:MAG: hypothetical protein B5766_04535 [Candidatus Lumbricidophila eiseniae]|uniref:Uncharacterized protein n=1 Tax=Candidatus Lumbricidiphila eiseniae TaxID=1969409 RepID=A0A2A6FSS4_9MICO|nr:MAG: hypothetical protein B5766_04535 [Candidatus Lumbricidophila eiseniae]